MQPWVVVDRAEVPGGPELVLARRGDTWVVRSGGRVLMTSEQHGSEESLADLALARASGRMAVLVGGLGMGYTARAALDRQPAGARLVVAERSAAVVGWNRAQLAGLAGRPLEDERVEVYVGDVAELIARGPPAAGEASSAWDAILLDVDNGPSALTHPGNARLYGRWGLRAAHRALRPGGVLAVWSGGDDARFVEELRRIGFMADRSWVPGRGTARGTRHVVFRAQKLDHGAQRRAHDGA